MKILRKLTALSLMLLFAGSPFATTATAQERMRGTIPGTVPDRLKSVRAQLRPAALQNELSPFYTESGLISSSIDAAGYNTSPDTLRVNKPSSSATVRDAFLLAASIPGSTLDDGDVALEGNPISWDEEVTFTLFSNGESARADVTSIVAPIVDAAPAGILNLDVSEPGGSSGIDGEILVVVFDDPSQTETRTVSLSFGAQDPAGDNFAISLANPFDGSAQEITMSLGISFGFQGGGDTQDSQIDVNGARLTSAAGGNDDGEDSDGALITAGGVGDDVANPPDPFQRDNGDARYDDELYTLDSFIDDGDTQISVTTQNPSNDDNIFFAAFVVSGNTAIVGEDILLTPTEATNPVGTDHTLTATVQDNTGGPITDTNVDFEVTSGPNAGLTASATTDDEGEAMFTYSSAVAGTDVIVASFINSEQETIESNEATKEWTEEDGGDATPPVCEDITFEFNQDGIPNAAVSGASDPESGIDEITFSRVLNLDGFYDDGSGRTNGFEEGDVVDLDEGSLSSVVFGGNRTDFTTNRAVLQVEVTNGAGLTSTCDPVIEQLSSEVPERFALMGNYPNPFSQQTTIEFRMAEDVPVTVEVFDMLGRKVATLADGENLAASTYELTWDGTNQSGQPLASGVYVYRIEAGSFTATRKMTLVR